MYHASCAEGDMSSSPGRTDMPYRRFALRSLVVGALSMGLVAVGWTNVSMPQSLAAGSDPMCSFTTYHSGLGSPVVYQVYVVGDTVYAATGHDAGNNTGGVSISTDGGQTYTNSTNGVGTNVASVFAQGSTVFAGTAGNGVGISTDGGATFSTTTSGLGSSQVNFVTAQGSTVYAATSPVKGPGGGLGISTNGGQTFSNISTQNGNGLPDSSVNSVLVVNDTLYVSTQDGLGISTGDVPWLSIASPRVSAAPPSPPFAWPVSAAPPSPPAPPAPAVEAVASPPVARPPSPPVASPDSASPPVASPP